MTTEDDAKAALSAMKLASETVRSAIASAIPVASNQVLTVAIPGTMINWKDFYYDADQQIKAPLAVQVKEARLVDGMVPMSKFTSGKTGKSVARSYLSALDLLVPIEASVSGVIGSNSDTVTDPRLLTIRNRYKTAMDFLKSADDSPGANGRSKVDTYVMKQAAWAKEVSGYAEAQGQALRDANPPPGATTSQIKESREKYMQWLQEHARDYKNTIQTKYMDWVVHGYKFLVDYNFGIIDIASGMKRIENSKEAFRNLTLIADDGSSEYQGVVLTPSDWATVIRDKVENWEKRNDKPTASEIRAELRRIENLLISHETLKQGIDKNAFFPVIGSDSGANDDELKKAYVEVYSEIDTRNQKDLKGNPVDPMSKNAWLANPTPPATPGEISGPPHQLALPENQDKPSEKDKDPFQNLLEAQSKWSEKSLSRNTNTVRDNADEVKLAAEGWLEARIKQLKSDITLLKEQLQAASSGARAGNRNIMSLPVVNAEGIVISNDEAAVKAELVGKAPAVVDQNGNKADKWTRISCKASRKTDTKETETFESASSVAVKVGWGLFSASGGASHTQSSAKAMSSMKNLDVEITMDCMVVEIDRPWLHAELFADAELDSGKFEISPGEEALKKYYSDGINPPGQYQQFSAFPTAFVVAADVELSFSGDTTHLESAVSASSTSANISVGYGPFSVSASHSQSKSSSKTKMESTSTGCKISVQAPQIVGWVQTLLPQLPKPVNGKSTMGTGKEPAKS